ncbi:MAG: 3-methyl-2-oxobutanoate hydroxymethyltransferase [bacterium]|nr:3-methyl-2-oxobutanoate hydroxymethyltransferase [bacterium]
MPRVTATSLQDRKRTGDKIAMLTAYDYPSAKLMDAAGVDVILVGDSCGMVVMGRPDTLSVTVDEMVHHTQMVAHATKRALVVADMPFMSYQTDVADAVRNAGRLVADAGAHAVKLEGPARHFGGQIKAILRAGVPVMGHLGLTPQSVHKFGGYKVQGRDEESREQLKQDALGLQEAGCFAVVLECIPAALAEEITASLDVPTIGIGAGPACDGQVLVMHDMLGWGMDTKFCKRYANVADVMRGAFQDYVHEVKSSAFPTEEYAYK